jgi:hypothetical protein
MSSCFFNSIKKIECRRRLAGWYPNKLTNTHTKLQMNANTNREMLIHRLNWDPILLKAQIRERTHVIKHAKESIAYLLSQGATLNDDSMLKYYTELLTINEGFVAKWQANLAQV